MSVSKKDLEKAIDEINEKIVDTPIKKKDEKKMTLKILKAAKLIEPDDDISKETLATIKKLKKAKGDSTEEEPKKKKKGKKKEATEEEPKKGKKKKTGKKKEGAGTSCYGHKLGCASGLIDEAVKDKKGHSIKKIADKLELKVARVLGHLNHLKNVKGVKMKIDGDKVKVL
jgi:hypothetical protein